MHLCLYQGTGTVRYSTVPGTVLGKPHIFTKKGHLGIFLIIFRLLRGLTGAMLSYVQGCTQESVENYQNTECAENQCANAMR